MSVFPSVLVLDVKGPAPTWAPGQRFCDVGALAHLATLWLATSLCDGSELIRAPEAAVAGTEVQVTSLQECADAWNGVT
ncbi:hypothetical protein ACFQ46_22385 [Kineococcus sp. GCM10028916]|uniref:hypothetical protein n=1 Tax=Kineococcus sp. GCM10028916 TaxID=3273394 RepID=UPI0036303178